MKNKLSLLLLAIFLLTPGLRAEEKAEKTISGIVVDLDWVSSSLAINYYPEFSVNADEINLKVTGDTVMRRGTDSISLSDIELSDPVTVTYYDDGSGELKIKRLTDLNLANR